jgi:hypothetical protein
VKETRGLQIEKSKQPVSRVAIDKERLEVDQICQDKAGARGAEGFVFGAFEKVQSTPRSTTVHLTEEQSIREQVRGIEELERRYNAPREEVESRDPSYSNSPRRGARGGDFFMPRGRRGERNFAEVFLEGIQRLVDNQRRSDTVTKKLELPVFSGKTEDYMNWRIHFMAGLSERHLTPQQKAMYLKGRVSGKPLEMLNKCASIRINDRSFDEWLEMLDENYGGPHKVQEQLAHELNSLPILVDVKKSSLQRFRLTLMLHYNYYKEHEPWALRTPNTMLLKSFKSKVDAKNWSQVPRFLGPKECAG